MMKPKILVADDEIHILHVIALKLRNAGFDVVTCRDGREAFELAQLEHPDLIITDYQMPYFSGLELCRQLRQLPSTRNIPAILLTARGFQMAQESTDDAGILLCIHKPFGPRELLKKVNEILALAAV